MAIPTLFGTQGGEAIASYAWTDIASGLGYVKFSAQTASNGQVRTYNLVTDVFEPGKTPVAYTNDHERWNVAQKAATETITTTFTSNPFTLPRVIKGKAYIVFTYASSSTGGACFPTVTLKQNATTLGTMSGAIMEIVNDLRTRTYCMSLDIPQTTVKKGDTLSISIGTTSLGGTNRIMLLFDSQNRDIATFTLSGGQGTMPNVDSAENPTELAVYLPFKIDL